MPQPIKLLVLTHNFPRFSGDYAGIFVSLLCRKLKAHDIDPIVLAPHDPGLPEKETLDGVTVYRFRYADRDEDENIAYRGNMHQLVLGSVTGIFKFKQFLDRFRKAALELIEKEQIDVVSGHWLVPSGIIMKTILRRNPRPLVLSSHGTDVRLMKKWMRVTYRYFKPFVYHMHRWTVVSSFLRDEILSIDKSLEPLLTVLPVPHDESLFDRDSSIERDHNLIVSVTRFTEQKRVDRLVKAFALVKDAHPQARLDIYGAGPLAGKVREWIDTFGLNDAVTLKGTVDQKSLRQIYNAASVAVLNSYREGFGLVLSEAMMCGAAGVGVDSGGITDIIQHQQTGLLAQLDDVGSLAEQLNRLLADRQLRDRLADAGYAYAHATYASGPLAERYAALIRSAAEG